MDDQRVCEGCGKPLARSRSDRRYHDATCRVRALRRRRRDAAAASSGVAGPALELDEALERALSEPRLVAYIARAAGHPISGWRAAAWLLERRFPERWAPGRVEPESLDGPVRAGDAFREVDELAEHRRGLPRPD